LVIDDGVKQLQYELKRRVFRPQLQGLKPSPAPIGVSVAKEKRAMVVHDVFVHLCMAHDEWKVAQASSKHAKHSIFKDNSTSPQVLLQGTAKKMELDLLKLVEQDTSGQAKGRSYVREIKDLRKRLIDDPLGQLNSAVLSSHTAKYVHVVMDPEEYGVNGSQTRPTEIEVTHPLSDNGFAPERPRKPICYGIKNIPPVLAAAPLWFGLVNGKPGRFRRIHV
jgi:hypothetical protein